MICGKRFYGQAGYLTWADPPPCNQALNQLINAPYVLFIVIMQARMKGYLLLNGITRNSLVNFLHLFLQSLDITYLLST